MSNVQIEQDIATIDERIQGTTQKLHRTLDRLTDNLDIDETAYYTQQRDSLKKLLVEYREEQATLTRRLVIVTVDPQTIQDYASMGAEYRETLETSEDFTFWRGLVDDLDITGIIGINEQGRRYIDFVVFGKVRKRDYIDDGSQKTFRDAGSGDSGSSGDIAGREFFGNRLCLG